MRIDPFDQAFTRASHVRPAAKAAGGRKDVARPPFQAAASYTVIAILVAAALFFAIWWLLRGSDDDAPWIPAGLVASIVIFVAAAAREVVVRRSLNQRLLQQDRRLPPTAKTKKNIGGRNESKTERFTAAWRALQQQSAQANSVGATPEAHLDVYQACRQYLVNADDALGTSDKRTGQLIVGSESRAVLRAGQERARALARQHLLAWARMAAHALTHEAQRRVRLADKIETAMRALDVINTALNFYPDEAELKASALAVQELVVTIKVAHWVELAERAAFKGQYAKAIDRYCDALFYLARGTLSEDARSETAGRINREVELLRARLRINKTTPAAEARRAADNI
ncbi:MAG: hypothetical protein ABR577_16890 [Pyrinomonadaceae bacterium]